LVSPANDQMRLAALDLWRRLFEGPPPLGLSDRELLDAIIKRLPEEGYSRLTSGPSRDLTFPKGR
jgi:hypothetical protein